MNNKKAFIGIILLYTFIALSASALWWNYSVEQALHIAIERQNWYELRYAALYATRMIARQIINNYPQTLLNLSLKPCVQNGFFVWRSDRHHIEYQATIQIQKSKNNKGDDKDSIIIITRLQRNKNSIILKALLHENNCSVGFVLDHYTFCHTV